MSPFRSTPAALFAASLLFAVHGLPAQEPLPSITEETQGMQRRDGFLPLFWDADAGKLLLEIPRLGEEMIYVVSLPTGLGSNDVGLDRTQLGGERIVRWERVGPKVLLVQPNYGFRAETANPDERRAVEESFATSTLWGFTAVAEEGGRTLVDATDFALADARDVVGTLKRAGQGSWKLEESRSAVHLPRTRAFPRNTEIEAALTFTSDDPGRWVRDVAPTPEAVTLRVRHSFVALPPPGYTPRRSDPRAGFFGISYEDYAVPLGQPLTQRFIARHRLAKRDPGAPLSDPVEPLVYYLDRGAPEPIRSALLDGARWWNAAFEAAGYRNAFRVELLPEDADPLDVRYNVIQWVHRATRGWSYGSSVTDPRTGEILKGHVLRGSLRARQDWLIAEGLLAPYVTGDEDAPGPEALALARLRQLAAHEVGHTLGLAHNYLASAEGHTSVMDSPHPQVRLAADGSIDLSHAYGVGVGAWDSVAIRYGYSRAPTGVDQQRALREILSQAQTRGVTFLSDQDARPAGSIHPQAHLWDNGADAATELRRVMRVRRVALDRFGEAVIRQGTPLATLEEALVPVYLFHRYQTEAAVKAVGGARYTYALRGDGQPPLEPVPPEQQRAALDAVLATLDPAELVLPRPLLAKLPPRPFTYGLHRELFSRRTGLAFDAVSPATAAARLTVELLLYPERAARLIEQHALDPELPGFGAVVDRLVEATFATPADGYRAAVAREVQWVAVRELMDLAATAPMPEVRAVATLKLEEVRVRAERGARQRGDEAQRAHQALLAAEIERFTERPYDPEQRLEPPEAPPGSPIGG
ncbi:zinc-dependent metalloprotease [soil metagenome]